VRRDHGEERGHVALIEEGDREHDRQEEKEHVECDLHQRVRRKPMVEEPDHAFS
jgi:hypothetical protein